ncbi:MAG: hypothetical protein J1E41_06575, partial [Ruminococcus sp.]|nr:hypothetical protein [Ruminococcus sp.]
MKKIIAVLLAIITALSILVVPLSAGAVDNLQATTSTNIEIGAWTIGQFNSDGAEVKWDNNNIRTGFLDVSAYDTIRITRNASIVNGAYHLWWYDKNKKFIERSTSSVVYNTDTTYQTIGCYLRIQLYVGGGANVSQGLAIGLQGINSVNDSLIDSSKKGSVTIYDYAIPKDTVLNEYNTGEETDYTEYLKSINATPLKGVTFKLTRVVDGSFTDGKNQTYYSANNITLPSMSDVKSSLLSNDGRFSELNTFTMTPTDKNGKTTLSNLPLGIYLVQEIDEPKSVIERVADYLISVPMTASDGTKWNYDIVTYPKTINGVVLTYDANNGTGHSTSEPRHANKTEPLTENPFTNGSKVFLGWADDPSSTIPDYQDMQDFTMPEHDKTIYAVWGYTNPIRYFTAFKYSEPWGLKLSFALLNPNTSKVIDYTKYDNYGIYVLPMHKEDTETPSMSEVIVKGKLYTDFTPQQLTFNDGSTDNYLMTEYDEEIYTQNLADDIYTLTYVTYKGRTFWGTVKNRCVEDSIDS